MIVAASASPSVLPASQHVTIEIVRSAKHYDGNRHQVTRPVVCARIHVDTYGRYNDFARAWGDGGTGPGVWQSFGGDDTWSEEAADGHVCWYIRCRKCRRVTEMNASRLEALLGDMWSAGSTTRQQWGP